MVQRPGHSTNPEEAIKSLPQLECGEAAREQFSFDPDYKNLNHGSFGTYPLPIRDVMRHYQDLSEARPDQFIRYDYPKYLDRSRQAVADYLHAPVEACVFVPNATTGINIVLRNLVYEPEDVIIYFATIYGACEKTVSYITETTPATSRKIQYQYPVSDAWLCSAFEETIQAIKSEGKNPRLAIFDTIVSFPGARMPFEKLTALCRKHGIQSCVDGAHGVGHIELNLTELDCDYFVSNCHKWLHVPRGCAVFYVPVRNQHLIRSTLPTSHGFAPKPIDGAEAINNPLPPSVKSPYITNFEFVGTIDNSPFLCVPAALEWRKKLKWKDLEGEKAIMAYTHSLSREIGKVTAQRLGTEVMENEEGTLGNCNLSMVRLPLSFADDAGNDPAAANKISQWVAETLVKEYGTFIGIFFYVDAWWVRLSSQVYVTVQDFEWGAGVLKEVCERVKKGDSKK